MAPRISSGVQGALKAGDKLSNNERSLTKQIECLARMRGDLSSSQVEGRKEKVCVSMHIYLLHVYSLYKLIRPFCFVCKFTVKMTTRDCRKTPTSFLKKIQKIYFLT